MPVMSESNFPKSMKAEEWAQAFLDWDADASIWIDSTPEQYKAEVAKWFEAAFTQSWSVMSGG